MLQEIVSYYNTLVFNEKTLENKSTALIKELDKLNLLVSENLDILIKKSANDSEAIKMYNSLKKNQNNYTLQSACEKHSASKEYTKYIFSYFESCLVVRNEMINQSKADMKYSYLFLLTHFFELILKKVVVHQNQSFKENTNDSFSTHDILKIISNNRDNFCRMGLKLEYYEFVILELEKISLFCNQSNDVQQCFKYPLKKDKKTSNISDDLINTDINALKKMVESHKSLLFIGLIIYILSNRENSLELNNMLNELIEKLKNILTKMEKIKEEKGKS